MEERKRYPVEFRGGQWWSVVPMLIFLVFCVVYFVGYKVFDMNALAVGGFLGLLIGALFCKTYGAYWDAVLRGIGSSTSVSIVVILLVIGMFTKLMAISRGIPGLCLDGTHGRYAGQHLYGLYIPGRLSDYHGYRLLHRDPDHGVSHPVSGGNPAGQPPRNPGGARSSPVQFSAITWPPSLM